MSSNVRWKIAQTAELIWWKKYLNKKSPSEYLLWKSQYWLNLLEKIGLQKIDFLSNAILDLGCGPAGIFMVFKNAKLTAVDPLLNKYDSNLPLFKKSKYPNVDFCPVSIESFNSSKTFDYVFCLNAINHVADLKVSFDKMVECLSPNGKLIVSIDTHNSSFLKQIFRLLPGDILHPHQYDLKEYAEMITQRNCTINQTLLYKKESIFNYYIIVAVKNG